MRVSVILAPTAEPIALAEAKNHLRVDHPDDDDLIEALVTTAREYVEDWTDKAIISRTLRADRDSFPNNFFELPQGPVRSVSSVQYLDSEGDETTLATTKWQADIRAARARVMWEPGESWPTVEQNRFNAVYVTYVTGYAIPFSTDFDTDANQCDAVAHPLANGDSLQLWNTGGELPAALAALTNFYVVNATTDAFELSLTSGGSPVTLTDDGSGTNLAGLAPKPLLAAIKLIVGHLYEFREEVVSGTILTQLPLGIQRLLMPYTTLRF